MRLQGGTPTDWLVCGWFTEDSIYKPLAERLAASLDAVGAPYDLVSVSKRAGGWESNTLAKAEQARAAMDRHPAKTIVLMDIDYAATGDLSYLAKVPGDVALQIFARRRKHRRGSSRASFSAQVIVIKPTPGARRFVETWERLSANPHPGATSEAYLGLACGSVTDVALVNLDQERLKAVLAHSFASKGHRMPDWRRVLLQITHGLRPARA